MAKKPKIKPSEKIAARVLKRPVNDIVFDAMLRYGTYTVEDRAVPAQDGLKPVQRRILWAMNELGAKDHGYKTKCAKVVGQTMGSYHPHGDLSIYDALVRLVTSIPYPIIHGEGNFGSHNDPPAAYRYTTCHFTKFGYKIYFDPYYLRVIEKIPNYDGTTEEPMVLPALLPMSLIIPQSGIAVAISTNVPSFSVESIYKTISLMLSKGKMPSAKWLAHNLEWTSAFGGKVITEKDDLIPIMETGYGRVEWECDYKYDGKSTVTITGIPPGWNIESKIAAIAKEPYIAECAEQTDKGGLKIVIRFKRADEESMDENMHKFKKHLRSAQTISNNCIVRRIKEDEGFKETESDFKQRPITDILKEWCAWRIDLEKKALRYESKLVKEAIERDRLLEKTIDNLDVIFALLKKKGIDKVKELAKKMSITEEQSKFIWSIAVGRLDRLNMDSVQESIKKSKDRLRILKGKFENPSVSVLDQLKTMKLTA